jgi:lipopolysaccharide transport system permease protein
MQGLLAWNPMAVLMDAYQQIFVWRVLPAWPGLAGVSVLALVLCAVGWRLFRRHAGDMVDEL